MESGIWALIGVAFGTILNLLLWLVQFKLQRNREDRQMAASKLEELSCILTEADGIFKKAVIETMRTSNLVEQWLGKDPWMDLKLIKAKSIVMISFPNVLEAFDSIQMPISQFAEKVKELMNSPSVLDRSGLAIYYKKFVEARDNFIQACVKEIQQNRIGNKSIKKKQAIE